MTGIAIDEAPVSARLEILHLSQLLVDRTMHRGHLSCRTFRAFIVLREVLLIVAVRARNAERMAVSQIHDEQQPARRYLLEDWNLNVLEYLFRGLLFVACDLLGHLLSKAVVDLLDVG